jgi:hypothetical protein
MKEKHMALSQESKWKTVGIDNFSVQALPLTDEKAIHLSRFRKKQIMHKWISTFFQYNL